MCERERERERKRKGEIERESVFAMKRYCVRGIVGVREIVCVRERLWV